MKILGACHCGNISYRLDWSSEPSAIPARACDCSFCTKHGCVWTSCPEGSLEVHVKNEEAHSAYSFETRTSLFHLCTTCGAVPFVTCKIDEVVYAVVNVNTFDNVAPTLLRRASVSFGAEDIAARLARRKSGWIGRVLFETSTSR